MANTLTNKINAILLKVNAREYQGALNQLQNDVLKKTDGCATIGAPDKDDFIITATAQSQVYPIIMEAINLLSNM